MKRLEIIANQSVQEDIVTALEAGVPGLQYSLMPTVHGRGPDDWKLGTTVWPEENFLLFSYLEDEAASRAKSIVDDLKVKYPREGIKAFTMTVD